MSGNWDDSTKWSSNPNFPNNGNGGFAAYDAVISATGSPYTVTLAVPITIEDLVISSANATVDHTASTFTATGAISLTAGTYQLNGGVISNTTINANGTGVLSAAANATNLLTGVTVNGDLILSATGARTKIAGGTTFTAAHLSGIHSSLGFTPGQTLTGTILFEGANPGTRNVEMDGNPGALTIGATAVIRTETGLGGAAQIGATFQYGGAMALTNQGLISSQVTGNTLTVQPDTLASSGLMQAINGGILTIAPSNSWTNTGTISLDATSTINLGGTFDATGGIGTFSNAAGGLVNITGTLDNTAATLTLDDTTGSWTLAGGTLSGGTLGFANGKTLLAAANATNLLTGVTVNGDLILSATGGRTKIAGGTTFSTAHLSGIHSSLGFAPDQTLTGTILFEGANPGTRNVEMDGNPGALTIGATAVIRTETGLGGAAQIGGTFQYGGAMALTNQGLISSQVTGNTLTVQPDTLASSGLMQAINGGILTIAPSKSWTNTGTISLDATSTINLGGTFDATGGIGTFSNAAGGLVNITGTLDNTAATLTLDDTTGSWTLAGGTLSGGTLGFANGKTLLAAASGTNRLTGVTVNGDLILSATGGRTKIAGGTTFATAHLSGIHSSLGFAPDQTLTGTILFEGANPGTRNVEMDGNPGALTIGATAVIRTETGLGGAAQIGGTFQYGGAMALTNQGLISSQVAGNTLTVQPDTLASSGLMQAINGGILTIAPSHSWTNTGTISLDATSTINLGGTFDATGGIGTFSNAAGGLVNITGTLDNTAATLTLDDTTGSWTLAGGTISGGTLGFANGKTLLAAANDTNRLTGVTVNGDLILSATGGRTKIAGGTTFATAHLSGIHSSLGFAPDQTLTGTILFEGANPGTRNVEMDGNPGALTIGATAVIRTETGLGGAAQIGGTFQYGGAMALTNQGLISSQVTGNTLTVQPDTLASSGLMQAINGGILTIAPSKSWTNTGTISLDATSTINLGGTFDATGGIGTFSNAAGGLVNITGTLDNTAATLTLDDTTGSWTWPAARSAAARSASPMAKRCSRPPAAPTG